ncbi:MAG: DNA mismatch repair protein MutS, partial [Rudaea sp.]
MTTPLRQQYLRIKKQFPDVIVMFRLGDFYETFDQDAKTVSEVCNIVLTGRDMGTGERVPLAGVPYHAVESYLARLISAGHKVAIVEQMAEEPAKGLMNREVTRVVTPGTVVEPALLEDRSNNFLSAVCVEDKRAGLASADITTGEFLAVELDVRDLRNELDRLHPAEVLLIQGDAAGRAMGVERRSYATTAVPALDFDAANQMLLGQFETASLDGFGLTGLRLAARAAAGIVRYLRENQKAALAQLRSLRVYSTDQFMVLDPPTRRNLELLANIRGGGTRGSLLGVLDETRTAMGGRLLRQWLTQPLQDVATLSARLDRVEEFFRNTSARERIRDLFKSIGDLERLTNRVVQGIAPPREVRQIRAGLELVPQVQAELESTSMRTLDACTEVSQVIGRAIVDDPPANLANGGAIAPGFSAELDSIKQAAGSAKDWVAALERTERERTGIRSLKVGYNRVFGYYLEVTTPNLPQVPPEYIRKQTLANAERFITPELKEYESLILNAEERISELESSLFRGLCTEIAGYAPRLLATARAVAELDVYTTLAEVALRYRYVRPVVDDGDTIEIRAGRHPVVELSLRDEPFVPNDCLLSAQDLIHIITGPNMSGKSTCLRQVALIVLMAQIGSFVPADSARIG